MRYVSECLCGSGFDIFYVLLKEGGEEGETVMEEGDIAHLIVNARNEIDWMDCSCLNIMYRI